MRGSLGGFTVCCDSRRALSYVRSGNYNWNSGGLNNRGSNGNYWSAATYNTNNSRNLNFNASNLNPRNGNNKGNGFAVRCVASSV